MRYAIFSDIHGNLPAWEQVLADIRALDADVLICLGDVVGYGPKPQEVLDGIRNATDHFVLGNHDAAAAGLIDPAIFNDHAHAVVLWTRENLTDESLKFLRNVPLEMSGDDLLFVHAELADPGRFDYIEGIADAEAGFASRDHFLTFIGHTHHPLMFERQPCGAVNALPDTDRVLDPKCRYIVNVGSAGEPRNPDDIRARYVIYDSDTRQVFFRRIEFDTDAYRRDLAATSLTHKPYFIEVLDNKTGEVVGAEAQDMQVPVRSAQCFNTTQRTLVIPLPSGSATKPKPKPVPVSSSEGKSAGRIFLIIGGLVAILVGGWFYLRAPSASSESNEELLISENSSLIQPPSDEAAVVNTDLMTPMQKLYSDQPIELVKTIVEEVPAKESPAAEVVKPEVEMTATLEPSPPMKITSDPEPIPLEEEPELTFKTISHWPMNSESIEGALLTREGGVELRQTFPPKPFDKIAPDPLPQTGQSNASSLARGGWEEKDSSGEFALTADHSFTFEGWAMISPQQPPVFIGGTSNTDRPGWRLDIKSAKGAEDMGSIRFQYSNGTDTITAQNNEITLREPTPHHFATIWHHDGVSADVGKLEVYFDGGLMSETELPHTQIATADPSLFQLSSPTNPERFALDEIRFTKGRLRVNEFLLNPPGPNPGGVVTQSGFKRATLLYAIDDDQFDFDDDYTKDNSSEIESGTFERVGYFVELGEDWVWVSMDRFQEDPKLVGVPKAQSNIVETGTVVKNLVIESSREDLNALNRPGLTGIIEFWASNYGAPGGEQFGSDDKLFDWKDSGGTTKAGCGSFQVFAFSDDSQTSATTLFGITKRGGAGIGNQESTEPLFSKCPDWTFGPGTGTYGKRNLEIWVGN